MHANQIQEVAKECKYGLLWGGDFLNGGCIVFRMRCFHCATYQAQVFPNLPWCFDSWVYSMRQGSVNALSTMQAYNYL